MNGHTPAPWHVASKDQNWFVQATDTLGQPFDICALANWDIEANARLIAAAPELLQALTDILDGVEDESVTNDGVDGVVLLPLYESEIAKARAAIAKATQP